MGSSNPSPPNASAIIANSKDMDPKTLSSVAGFLKTMGVAASIPPEFRAKDTHSDLIRSLLKVDLLERGRVSCTLSVKPLASNIYGGMHGGAVASVAEMVSIACVRTVVAKDKEIFLGDLSICYLSAARLGAKLTVDASAIKSGRNMTVVALEMKAKDSGKLIYTSRAIFYNMPASSL